jgi:sugar phosphate isomerase/epimerase
MILALSTRWNAYRHASGEAMLEEIREAGFTAVELGYDLRLDLLPGVRQEVRRQAVRVVSLHNFCPVPVGAPQGHPELFQLADPDARLRRSAVQHTLRTAELAAELGAPHVVAHAGNVAMRNRTARLIALAQNGKRDTRRYERVKMRALAVREKKVRPHLDALNAALEEMLPTLDATGVSLALENLPSWEAVPSETEMEALCRRFDSPRLRYWHDFGHAQIRQNLGFIAHHHWLARLAPWLAGCHVHDVAAPACDHLMPPDGDIDFAAFQDCLRSDLPVVLEPAPGMAVEKIREALRFLSDRWPPAAASAGVRARA